MREMSKENQEITCCEYFLDWYNKQHKRNYTCEKATERFPELNKNNQGDWDFVAFERDNLEEWIGIEVKELATTREVSRWFEFWEKLCSELTQDLASKGIQGKFKIIHPPVFNLRPEDRIKFRTTIIEVLINKQSTLKADFVDIGPDITSKFLNWPTEKSEPFDEYDKWGTYRPCKLEIRKISDSGCEVTSPISPIRVFDVPEKHEEAFNAVFKPKNDVTRANKQLKLAKVKRAKNTMLLLCCDPSVEESLIQNEVQKLDRHLISDIDYIYLVDVSINDRVVKMYPG